MSRNWPGYSLIEKALICRRQWHGQRLAWIFHRSDTAYFFANSLNSVSIELHRRLGFEEVQRDFAFPGASFVGGGVGILYRARRTISFRTEPGVQTGQ